MAGDERRLPLPGAGSEAAAAWVAERLADLCGDDAQPSPAFRGGQHAADAALRRFPVRGYASRRNEVWPTARRGASRLSPYIRHGLLSLPEVWEGVAGGPERDVGKFRDELLWQEYARHLYARLGARTGRSLRSEPPVWAEPGEDAWSRALRCLELARRELERDGWLPNQARMWLASHWSVRRGAPWRDGEDVFFRELLDGSRAANRLGWQWTTGAGSGRPYGFSRWQVEKRSPRLCRECALAASCPIEDWPETRAGRRVRDAEPALAQDPDLDRTRGPEAAQRREEPEAVWLTAESLGARDPALAAHPELPAVFVFDAPLLARLRLSRKRLVFLVETLAELGASRPLELHRGEPRAVLRGRRLATTYAPVPGWRRLAARLDLAELHPWPWLAAPHDGSLRSFSAWRKRLGEVPERAPGSSGRTLRAGPGRAARLTGTSRRAPGSRAPRAPERGRSDPHGPGG